MEGVAGVGGRESKLPFFHVELANMCSLTADRSTRHVALIRLANALTANVEARQGE